MCGVWHFPKLAWAHERCASNVATQVVPASNAVVDNAVPASNTEKPPKQRWDREKYNANAAKYMREYRSRKNRAEPPVGNS